MLHTHSHKLRPPHSRCKPNQQQCTVACRFNWLLLLVDHHQRCQQIVFDHRLNLPLLGAQRPSNALHHTLHGLASGRGFQIFIEVSFVDHGEPSLQGSYRQFFRALGQVLGQNRWTGWNSPAVGEKMLQI